ncbi:hypothetical protein [Janthinobacterium sp.]|uniref:hypothetical protein n=1 Tax=Janthinobacterium sp. TaxID=1871054 RepID=UPI0028A16673|nr:hypothetical protein [Janthinobacterium sp.]
MFEPLTQTVSQLATRWGYSVHDVLTHAIQKNWPVYFHFEGLVFDVADRLRYGHDWRAASESSRLAANIEGAEHTLQRNVQHLKGLLTLTEWEDVLSEEDVRNLRIEIEGKKKLLKISTEMNEERNEARQQFHRNGALRAAPRTLQDVADHGLAAFPLKAFYPNSPAWYVPNAEAPGQLLKGRLVALEDVSLHPKTKITADDLFATMEDIKAIESEYALAAISVGTTNTSSTVEHPSVAPRIWDEVACQKLLTEYNAPGATQETLAKIYGVSRQFIARKLTEARGSLVPKKAGAFDGLGRGSRKK